MKLALSNSLCPDLPLAQLVEQARAWGYSGIELAGSLGEFPALRPSGGGDASPLRRDFDDAGLQLVGLNSGFAFGHSSRSALEGRRGRLGALFGLAETLGCGSVSVSGAPVPATTTKAEALSQTGRALADVALDAADHGVLLGFENAGAFAGSEDTWFLRDAAGAPNVRVCWNILNALLAEDTVSIAVPRLASSMFIVRVADARLDGRRVAEYTPLGAGHVALAKLIELLRGLAYSGWLCVHWPADAAATLPPPAELLPAAAAFLRGELDRPVVELSAYKGDKQAPRFGARPGAAAASGEVK